MNKDILFIKHIQDFVRRTKNPIVTEQFLIDEAVNNYTYIDEHCLLIFSVINDIMFVNWPYCNIGYQYCIDKAKEVCKKAGLKRIQLQTRHEKGLKKLGWETADYIMELKI